MQPGDLVCLLNSLRKISSDVRASESLEEEFREEILRETEAMERLLENSSGK